MADIWLFSTEENAMTPDDLYIHHVDQPYGKRFAETVGRFQEGFLRDGVCDDLDDAFARAVDAAVRLVPVLKLAGA